MKKQAIKAGILSFFILAAITLGAFLAFKFFFSQEAVSDRDKAELPSAVAANQATGNSPSDFAKASPDKQASKTAIPNEVNWEVPFLVQAPTANWDKTHEEACEEAAILMGQKFYSGVKTVSSEEAEKGLQDIIAWENQHLGFFESTNTNETARVGQEMFGLKTEIIDNPTTDQIKQALADKKLVLVPSAGREIGNPFYKQPGPLYHMLLIKGYTAGKFITNDAGTRRGENYPYDFKTILAANHDWNGGDVLNGAKKIIVVWK